MSASKTIKEAGLSSTLEASVIANKTTRMIEWNYHNNRQFFDVIVAGCVVIKGKDK